MSGNGHTPGNETPVPKTPAPKNIVICLDGTGNQIGATRNTNVIRLFRALENTTGRQIVYYDPGVGTFSSAGSWTRAGRWWSRMLGLAFGVGMKTNLAEAYTFLMNHWEPGDRIYLFGFSRGAYTARALAGMLNLIGIPRPSSENLVQYAIAMYARPGPWTQANRDDARKFSSTVCRAVPGNGFSVPVEYLGVWDTVSAPGIYRAELTFEDTRELAGVRAGRHAISIDERRRPYRECPVENRRIEEAWFAGVHSDVGGGFREHELADITLRWVLDDARDHGLLLRARRELRELPTVTTGEAMGQIHHTGRLWNVLIPRDRRPVRGARVHASVRVRRDTVPKYRPHLVSPVWVDEGWCVRDAADCAAPVRVRTPLRTV